MSETNAVKDESGVAQRSELQPVVMCEFKAESHEEYFERMLNFEEHFLNIEDFCSALKMNNNASGSLGNIAARTIDRLLTRIAELE